MGVPVRDLRGFRYRGRFAALRVPWRLADYFSREGIRVTGSTRAKSLRSRAEDVESALTTLHPKP